MEQKMIIRGIIIEAGRIGSCGDVIQVDVIKAFTGAKLNHKPNASCIPVSMEFDQTAPHVGFANCYVDGEVLKADIEFYTPKENHNKIKKFVPAIGGQILDSVIEGDIRKITAMKLTSVGLTLNPSDKEMLTIEKQIEAGIAKQVDGYEQNHWI